MQPVLPPRDILALSFVSRLPRAIVFPLLRGELPPTGPHPRLPFDLPPERDDAPCDSIDALLSRMGCERRVVDVVADARRCADRAVAMARARGIDVLILGEAAYPTLLAHIFDPPLVLWTRGRAEVLSRPAVAVVGSRAASPYGEEAAGRLGSELGAQGVVVVSGMARGIDAAAHRGALAVNGDTVAVLGCGADVLYPPEHGQLAAEILRRGAILSEYPPGTPPTKFNFPRRNRIISGLSRGVVVVEASFKSGALITANCALEQGRDVMAVPGNVLSERHRGSHTLLKCGAALVESATDVMQALQMVGSPAATRESETPADVLLDVLERGEAMELDELATTSGQGMAALLPRLLELELQGLVRRVPGGRFVRSGRSC